MTADRYGRSTDERTDRRLRILGAVLGAGLLGLVGWYGYSYVAGQDISAEIIKFKVVSDSAIEVHLEVRKDQDASGYCMLRSRSEDGAVVGRLEVRFDQPTDRIDEIVTVRTTARATNAELTGCTTDPASSR
ncbi:DUF4307 domain-containing protein [Streptomyces sannanensis]|uniref:DUF4307 domain-containing protein n=1 Tax=Streptomyces sannanensis TaxID=285536 RepID=A0ABP6SEW1_9ACTN